VTISAHVPAGSQIERGGAHLGLWSIAHPDPSTQVDTFISHYDAALTISSAPAESELSWTTIPASSDASWTFVPPCAGEYSFRLTDGAAVVASANLTVASRFSCLLFAQTWTQPGPPFVCSDVAVSPGLLWAASPTAGDYTLELKRDGSVIGTSVVFHPPTDPQPYPTALADNAQVIFLIASGVVIRSTAAQLGEITPRLEPSSGRATLAIQAAGVQSALAALVGMTPAEVASTGFPALRAAFTAALGEG
jgi:hypothetical protein